MNHLLGTALVGAAALAMANSAAATELRFASGWPPNSAPTAMVESFAERVEEISGGDVTMKVYPLSLLNFAEINAGVRDGIADLAVNITAYFPSEYPNFNMLNEYSEIVELDEFAGDRSQLAYAGAMMEYIMLNCADCRAEVEEQNQIYLGAFASTTYALQCMTPLETAADLKGKRIRVAGAYWSRWAEHFGAVPVSMSVNETLEGLNQGVVDCNAGNTADFVNFGIVDIVDHLYLGLPGALYVAPVTMNKDSWSALTDDDRADLLRANTRLMADIIWVYIDEAREGRERALEKGSTYGLASDELIEMNREFVQQDMQAIASIYRDRFGIQTGEAAAEKLTELMRKWTDLTKGAENAEELAEVYWTEVASKVDVSSYGQ
ncbi:TRAP-T family transporter, DctP (periplasmic binding) subunit [Pseudooceanicola batsensis HTCC2597]|uniref:TRAP-T family transporter, DctP (Periplasmic binding) subunit n=1 Tax=Pseudooceanicola batsensis (strain ATCC BAA-863 / DSM 15984 / KCTC 12145 / HTCC2597) TaxID=252305 RepID=A3U1D2_PSEBH|nr:C4-dicarboxylate TRAP transporter substrate-binding protein [Pseudooceanicola batsensis]EAQ02115.1 TRAP-T family transporter, DctP (periplasmic binding) subunit [Pseudooceanicola batsensis HTCC2597]